MPELARFWSPAAPARLPRRWPRRRGVVRVGRPEFDFDRPETIAAVFHAVAPRLVVNAAAYTAVDAAENDADAAYRANRDGPATLARLCAAAGIPLIHISTDYVFDGTKPDALCRDRSGRAAGRLRRQQAGRRAGGAGRRRSGDHPAHRLGLRRDRQEFRPHHADPRQDPRPAGCRRRPARLPDHRRRPRRRDPGDHPPAGCDRLAAGLQGVFHAAGTGATTWHGLAVATFEAAARHGARVPEVAAITTAE